MKPINIATAKELVKTYKAMTIEDIILHWDIQKTISDDVIAWRVLNELIGFGNPTTCKLCQSICNDDNSVFDRKITCLKCIYGKMLGCLTDTYTGMTKASTPLELLNAIQKRAEYIEDILAEIE